MKTWKSPRIRVKVTHNIIEQSKTRDSKHCMIAEAVKQAYPLAKNISVDLATIRLTNPNKRLRFTYLTPRIAQVPLVKFDRGDNLEPFEFLLRGGIVTQSGSSQERRGKEKQERTRRQHSALRKARMVGRGQATTGTVADRIGGTTPPVQSTSDGVPFSRRRAFGLRALSL